jgi:hypothetical protein
MASERTAIRISLLGRFEVSRSDRVLRSEDWPRRKAASLLQRLALERRLLKDEAVDFLWPESDLASGANNLYRTLHALRDTLNKTLVRMRQSLFSALKRDSHSQQYGLGRRPRVRAAGGFTCLDTRPPGPGWKRRCRSIGRSAADEIYADWTVARRSR